MVGGVLESAPELEPDHSLREFWGLSKRSVRWVGWLGSRGPRRLLGSFGVALGLDLKANVR